LRFCYPSEAGETKGIPDPINRQITSVGSMSEPAQDGYISKRNTKEGFIDCIVKAVKKQTRQVPIFAPTA